MLCVILIVHVQIHNSQIIKYGLHVSISQCMELSAAWGYNCKNRAVCVSALGTSWYMYLT